MVKRYYSEITHLLRGRTPAFEGTHRDRLDWAGSSALLDLYDKTSGQAREEIIRAMGQIIEENKEPPFVIAQLLHIAASLELSQIQASIERLQAKKPQSVDVQDGIKNYLAFRKLAHIKLKN